MAVFSGLGMLIEYDKKSLRPYGWKEPEPPLPPPPPRPEHLAPAPFQWPILKERTKPVEAIIEAALKHWGVTRTQFLHKRHHKSIVWRRHIAAYICREDTIASYPAIGRRFGMDHTSILHAANRMEKLIAAGHAQAIADVAAVRAIVEGHAQ